MSLQEAHDLCNQLEESVGWFFEGSLDATTVPRVFLKSSVTKCKKTLEKSKENESLQLA